MLIVSIPDLDGFDEETGTFVSMPGGILHLEHNLVALSKWESITHKHLIGNDNILKPRHSIRPHSMLTISDEIPHTSFIHQPQRKQTFNTTLRISRLIGSRHYSAPSDYVT